MPELPEVETVRRGLDELLVNRAIDDVITSYDKSFPNSPADVNRFLIGSKVTAVKRRAKVLMIELDTNYTLLIHLKMTGQLVYRADSGERFGAGHPNDSLIGKLPDRSTRVSLQLNNAQLFFNDQRRFGWMRLLPTVEIPNLDFFKKVGPEPLAADFTKTNFQERLMKRPNTTIKAALLDQTVIAGVGNIYADESLWGAKIHPATRVKDVSVVKLGRLYESLRAVLQLSIDKGGSSDRNYVDATGKKGSYLAFANVFRREGQSCPRCGHEIIKLRVAGRGTHICPNEQRVKA
ncbi:MAG: bifunctional DNA-formamidopyrimidine glycosylase/DNA-(apurinic or apyrimidinic site) lyase [Candidatus Saccharibacteria bacterium]